MNRNVKNKGTEMVKLIRQLADSLAKEPLSLDDVSAMIGQIMENPGPPLPIRIRPSKEGLQSAELFQYPESGAPYLLSLQLSTESQLALSELGKEFGDYKRALTDRGAPAEFIFSSPVKGARWWVYLFAELEPGELGFDSQRVRNIQFRRDSAE